MDREESIRRASDEARRVNFTSGEDTPHHSVPPPHGKELVKKDSFRGSNSTVEGSPRQQKKFISTWRMACDKTKDRTKELLKKWRTMPEGAIGEVREHGTVIGVQENGSEHGWSVHVWATWVKRYPSDEDTLADKNILQLTDVQKDKLAHFFSHVFDMDRDDIISIQDFESFTERVRHFTDWSTNSGEYLVLEQVQQGLVETFIYPMKPDTVSEGAEHSVPFNLNRIFISIEDWLFFWNELLVGIKSFSQLPIWLQYFSKILFNAINRSGNGVISRDELSSFYSSVLGYPPQRVGEILDRAYQAMTANGDYKLEYSIYRLCFANFLFGRFPNGPGQFIFGCPTKSPPTFPIDYSSMNSNPEDLECYSLERKETNRALML